MNNSKVVVYDSFSRGILRVGNELFNLRYAIKIGLDSTVIDGTGTLRVQFIPGHERTFPINMTYARGLLDDIAEWLRKNQ